MKSHVDTHVVRTTRESLLIALAPDGTVRRVEVTVFQEPREFTAPEPWRGFRHCRFLSLTRQRPVGPRGCNTGIPVKREGKTGRF